MKKSYRLFSLLWLQSIVLLACFLTACNNDSSKGWSFSDAAEATSSSPNISPSANQKNKPITNQKNKATATPSHRKSTSRSAHPAPPSSMGNIRLSIEPNTLSLFSNQEKPLEIFELIDSRKTNVTNKIKWSVTDPAIAEVSQMGVVMAKSVGATTIKAHLGNSEASLNINVNKNSLESIEIEPANTESYANEKIQFKARGFYSDQSNKDISKTIHWSVDDTCIASIDHNGLLTTLSPGKTTVNANGSTLNQLTKTQITVKEGFLTGLKMSSNDIDVTVGLKNQLVVIGTYNDGVSKEVTNDCDWTSDKPNFAAVDNNDNKGLITGISVGNTNISANLGDTSTSTIVTVDAPKITKVTVEPDGLLIAKGYSHQLQAIASFENNTTRNITKSATWKSANTALATVNSSGAVSALKQGETFITATFNKFSSQSKIKITAPMLKSLTIYPVPEASELIVNMPHQFLAQGIFSDGDEMDLTTNVTWKSNDATIASIKGGGLDAGLITPHSNGNVTISATDPKTNMIAKRTIPVKKIELTHIDLEPDNPDIPAGTHVQMTATGFFSDEKKVDITTDCVWSTGSGKIAEVSKQGLVTGIRRDSTPISASFLNQSASTNLTVSAKKLKALEISPQNPTMESVTSLWFKATAIYHDGSKQDVTKAGWWHSSNPFIALIGTLWPVWGRTWAIIPGDCNISFGYQGMKVVTPLTVTY